MGVPKAKQLPGTQLQWGPPNLCNTSKKRTVCFNHINCGYVGCRQAEEAVVMRGLLRYWRLIAYDKL